MTTMPAVVHYELAPRHCELRRVSVPEIGPDDVLLRVAAVGVCGSDVHQYHNTHSWPVRVPVILGHEFCGEIERVVRLLASGDLDPRPLVSRVSSLDEWQPCFEGMATGELVKAVLIPDVAAVG